jgi:hypothetical protein
MTSKVVSAPSPCAVVDGPDQGADRAQLLDCAGSAGQRTARGGSYHPGGSQSVFGTGVCALVESTSRGSGCPSDRCAPAPGCKSRSGCSTEPCRSATNRQRLHLPLSEPVVSDRHRAGPAWIAWRSGACRSPVGWFPHGSFSGAISQHPRMSAATQSLAARIPTCRSTQSAAPAQSSLATGPEWDRAPRRYAPVESGRNQSHSHTRRTGISSGQSKKERRSKAARRTFAFTQPKASARKLHHPDVATSKSKTPEQRRSRVLAVPIRDGASPVASALGIRLGATPCGLTHLNMPFSARPSKPDISTWQRIGHFYLALTYGRLVIRERAG